MKALTPDTTASAALQETGTGLELRNITHAYGPVTSLDDVSLSVAPGEVLCLLGHSIATPNPEIGIIVQLFQLLHHIGCVHIARGLTRNDVILHSVLSTGKFMD